MRRWSGRRSSVPPSAGAGSVARLRPADRVRLAPRRHSSSLARRPRQRRSRGVLALRLPPSRSPACGRGSGAAAGRRAAWSSAASERASARSGCSAEGQEPKALVVFIHGRGGKREDTPYYHRRCATSQSGATPCCTRATSRSPATRAACAISSTRCRRAAAQLPHGLPIVLSRLLRGGGIAVDYSALDPEIGTPRAVLAVFPILLDARLNLHSIPPRVRFLFFGRRPGHPGRSRRHARLAAAASGRRLSAPAAGRELVRSQGAFRRRTCPCSRTARAPARRSGPGRTA